MEIELDCLEIVMLLSIIKSQGFLVELVDTPDLGFGAARCVSSSLTEATIFIT